MNQETYFTNQTMDQAINQNMGLSGQSAAQTAVGALPEQVIATDLLVSAKVGVTGLAKALTEASTPELRTKLKQYLDGAIAAHETLFNYMTKKGWYDAANPQHMVQIDVQCADNALQLQ